MVQPKQRLSVPTLCPPKLKFGWLAVRAESRLHNRLTAPAVLALTIVILCSFQSVSHAETAVLYRVINKAGNVELKATISAEEAKRGYKIVNASGRVIKEVLPELSGNAYDALSIERRKAHEAEQREKAKQAYHESLLLRYSNVDDLNAVWRRKLQEFDIRISILVNNRAALREKMESQQKRAANLERQNLPVPEVIEKNIAELEREMTEANSEINFRREEKEKIDEKYAQDAERLCQLLEGRNGGCQHGNSPQISQSSR